MPIQQIELEEAQMIELSDDALEFMFVEAGAQYTQSGPACC